EIELFIKKQGADISFRPIVAFGANASMPHYESSDKRKLKLNECILIDMGAKVDGYCSDMTRTVFFGKPTEEEQKIYETVLESQKRAIDYINSAIASMSSRPSEVRTSGGISLQQTAKLQQNTSITSDAKRSLDYAKSDLAPLGTTLFAKEVDTIAREYIISQGYPSIPHSLGHGIGIDVHEPPSLNPNSETPLQEGMVFSIEPG